jgi:hypothetical protein
LNYTQVVITTERILMKSSITQGILAALLISISLAATNYCCDISGLDKAVVIRALYAAAKPLGTGCKLMHYDSENNLSDDEVEAVIKNGSVGYLKGRVMKVTFRDDTLETWFYNRDNGQCTKIAESIIAALRKQVADNTEGKKK